jgi:tRNA/tmRNA/rRNA uracil-C5-methylase (TrmA/RlmC/RlmD family)
VNESPSAADALAVGDVVELDIGPVAHGGHCVARHHGRVVFVRLALPGERALVRITDAKPGSFARGEAVDVSVADPSRISAPCAHFGVGGCGGCDFQHALPARQRELKASVVAEQLRRLAGLDLTVVVEELPGGGFGWRTRVRWALDDAGRIGPRAVRSHRVVGVSLDEPCLIAADGLTPLAVGLPVPAGLRDRVAAHRMRGRAADRRRGGRDRRSGGRDAGLPEVALVHSGDGTVAAAWDGEAAPTVTEHAVGRDFSVAGDGFWQVHPAAAEILAGAVDDGVAPFLGPGDSAWDLYGGVGLFAAVLASRVGPSGSVLTVEADRTASALAATNLADLPQVQVIADRVDAALAGPALLLPAMHRPVDAIVLDPPRSGAGPDLCAALAGRRPGVIVYVACDPAALGRDAASLGSAGYTLTGLRAFDAFPQTHHVECVAVFTPADPRA